MMHNQGFTLVELAASLLIIAIIAGMAAISLNGLRQHVQLDDQLGVIQQFDRTTRTHAHRFGRAMQLVIDLDQGVLTRTDVGAMVNPATSPSIIIDPKHLMAIRLIDGQAITQWQTSGQMTVVYSPDGRSSDFALRLSNKSTHSPRSGQLSEEFSGAEVLPGVGVLVSGLSGQWIRWEQEQELESILAILTATRDDAR